MDDEAEVSFFLALDERSNSGNSGPIVNNKIRLVWVR